MGSAQSYISSEAAFTTLVVAGAIGLGYTQIGHGSTSPSASADATPKTPKSGNPTNNEKKKKQAKSGVVLSDDVSDKGQANTNNQNPTIISKPLAEPERVVNALPGFPGQFESTTSPDPQPSDVTTAVASSVSKAKKSKKKKAKAAVTDPIVPDVAASSSADYSEISTKFKTKNSKRQQQPQSSSSSQMSRPLPSTTSIDTDESWTRVGSVRRHTPLSKNSLTSLDVTTSDADAGLTSQTGNSSPIAERDTEGEEPSSFLLDIDPRESVENRRKTLAEKLLPKPRKTGVDELSFFQLSYLDENNSADNSFLFFLFPSYANYIPGLVSMLETPDHPTLARVIRVQPLPDEKPASGFSWGDYEDIRVSTDGGENDADGEDDGWGVVRSRRQRVDRASASAFTPSHHQTQKASETMTKRQRQNAQKRENEKAAKAEAESLRLASLAKHKRELERARMLEQYGGKSGGNSSSGGMRASVDDRGKLVWE